MGVLNLNILEKEDKYHFSFVFLYLKGSVKVFKLYNAAHLIALAKVEVLGQLGQKAWIKRDVYHAMRGT